MNQTNHLAHYKKEIQGQRRKEVVTCKIEVEGKMASRYSSTVGNLCKFSVALDGKLACYTLPFRDVTSRTLQSDSVPIYFNDLIGTDLQIEYHGFYNSLLSGVEVITSHSVRHQI